MGWQDRDYARPTPRHGPVTLTHGINRLFARSPAGLTAEIRSRIADPVGPPPNIEKWDGRAATEIIDFPEERNGRAMMK